MGFFNKDTPHIKVENKPVSMLKFLSYSMIYISPAFTLVTALLIVPKNILPLFLGLSFFNLFILYGIVYSVYKFTLGKTNK